MRIVCQGLSRTWLALGLICLALLCNACGGGGGSAPPVDDGSPAPGTADLNGQILQNSDGRVTSAIEASLSGAVVTLVNTDTGGLEGTDVTDSTGQFSFEGVPSRQHLLQVEIVSDADLNNDGDTEDMEFLFPIELTDGSRTHFMTVLEVLDSDGDGDDDSVDVDIDVSDDHGNSESELRRHDFEDGESVVDEDDDGDTADDEPFEDADLDGLPDDLQGHMNSLHGGILRGPIQSFDDDSITVNDIVFEITDATKFKDKGNKDPDPSVFSEGTNVHIRGMWNGEEWIAIEVKTTGPRDEDDDDGDGDDDDDGFEGLIIVITEDGISIEGHDFVINEDTEWVVDGSVVDDLSGFIEGARVRIEAVEDGDTLVATRITLLGDDDGGDDEGDDDDEEEDDDTGDDEEDDDGTGDDPLEP